MVLLVSAHGTVWDGATVGVILAGLDAGRPGCTVVARPTSIGPGGPDAPDTCGVSAIEGEGARVSRFKVTMNNGLGRRLPDRFGLECVVEIAEAGDTGRIKAATVY